METQVESRSSVGQCCSSPSKLVEQQSKEVAAGSSCIARQQRLYAAAAAAGLAESSDPACYETQAAERSHEEPGSGQLALHQIRRAVSNSSYLPPTPPLLLFMDIELTLSCLRELCI